MDMAVFESLLNKPAELAEFLERAERRLKPMLKMLTIQQLSNLATAFSGERPAMYDLVRAEIQVRVEKSAPHVAAWIDANWTKRPKGYTDDAYDGDVAD